MSKDFADTFVDFARGNISKDEMNKAVRRLSEDIVKSYTKGENVNSSVLFEGLRLSPRDVRVDQIGCEAYEPDYIQPIIRVTHIPTGTYAEANELKSPIRNRDLAFLRLGQKLMVDDK